MVNRESIKNKVDKVNAKATETLDKAIREIYEVAREECIDYKELKLVLFRTSKSMPCPLASYLEDKLEDMLNDEIGKIKLKTSYKILNTR